MRHDHSAWIPLNIYGTCAGRRWDLLPDSLRNFSDKRTFLFYERTLIFQTIIDYFILRMYRRFRKSVIRRINHILTFHIYKRLPLERFLIKNRTFVLPYMFSSFKKHFLCTFIASFITPYDLWLVGLLVGGATVISCTWELTGPGPSFNEESNPL